MVIKIWILFYSIEFITQLHVVTGVTDDEVANHCVADQYCLRLYQLHVPVGWNQAEAQCSYKGMELLSISDHNKQIQVETLLRNFIMPDELQTYIWMSGKKSHNVTWTSIDLNNTFHGTSKIIEHVEGNDLNADEENCLTGEFHDGQPAIYKVHCSEVMSAVKLICQWSTTIQVCYDTTHDRHYLNGVCYMFVDAGDRDWFSAQRLCQMRYGGDIFLNLPVTHADMGPMTQWISPGESMWIGAWRKPWRWISEYNELPMRYFNWQTGEGGKVSTDVTLCTVVHGDSGQWKDISCSSPCQYFICEGSYNDHNLPTSTSAISYSISITTTSLIATTEFNNWTTPLISNTMDKNEAGFKPVYIAAIAAGVIVVVVIVVAVILVKRRQLKKERNNNNQPSSPPQQPHADNDYIDLGTTSDGHPVHEEAHVTYSSNQSPRTNRSHQDSAVDSSTAVYSLARGADMDQSTGVRHIVTSQGDEYALPDLAVKSPRPSVDPDRLAPDGYNNQSGVLRGMIDQEDRDDDIMVDNKEYGSLP